VGGLGLAGHDAAADERRHPCQRPYAPGLWTPTHMEHNPTQLTASNTYSLTRARTTSPPHLTHSPPHSLTHSLTHRLTSPPHSLTSLVPSLASVSLHASLNPYTATYASLTRALHSSRRTSTRTGCWSTRAAPPGRTAASLLRWGCA